MSSKRGRKRNDDLPPNRARDVQRAFRARRAAHLQALEERVQELTEENETLRTALGLPSANRPPLGRGPTGKDKAKPFERSSTERGRSTFAEGSVSPRTTTSSPHSGSHKIASTSQAGNLGENSGTMWGGEVTVSSHDELAPDRVYSSITNAPSTSANYTPDHFRFDTTQHAKSRSALAGNSFPSQGSGTSGYHQPTDRSTNMTSAFSRDESFYSMTVSAASGRPVAQPSPGLHPHSVPHHMESSIGGGHSSMGSHSSSFSSASPASNPNHLNMSLNLRRSMNDPQHVPSYVDPYSSASYQQRAQPITHQSHNNVSPPTASSRLPPGHASITRANYAGSDLSPTGEPSFRRTT